MNQKKIKIVITGGHPSPALAVIDKIKRIKPEWELFFIGVKHPLSNDRAVSYEYKEITIRQIPFYNIKAGKISRLSDISRMISFLKLPLGFFQSFSYLLKIRPCLILSFGGYIGAAVASAAFLLGIPVITHEQTPVLGAANRFISVFAKKVLLSWPETTNKPKNAKIIYTGLPLRESLNSNQKPEFAREIKEDLPLLYITGGSQGSHFINQLVSAGLKEILSEFYLIHQTGESTTYNDLASLKAVLLKLPKNLQKRYFLKAHIASRDIGWILKTAKIVVSRAGINTIAELLYLKKLSIIIPLPDSADNEQMVNALILQKAGLGRILEQKNADSYLLIKMLKKMIEDIKNNRLNFDQIEGQNLQNPEATLEIIQVIQDIIEAELCI